MQWTKTKPTVEGDYWIGYDYGVEGFSASVRTCGIEDDDDPHLSWIPEWDGGMDWQPISEDSDDTLYYGPITHPRRPPIDGILRHPRYINDRLDYDDLVDKGYDDTEILDVWANDG